MTIHFGLRGLKARLIEDELWARMEGEWFADGPGKRDFVDSIIQGHSDGAGAVTPYGELIEGGEVTSVEVV